MCSNTEFFLVRIFPYSFRMQENTDQKRTPYLNSFHAVLITEHRKQCDKNSFKQIERERGGDVRFNLLTVYLSLQEGFLSVLKGA